MVEKSPEFTLVSWHSVLDRQIGKSGTGIMQADAIIWQFGRGRARPEISYHSTRCGEGLEP